METGQYRNYRCCAYRATHLITRSVKQFFDLEQLDRPLARALELPKHMDLTRGNLVSLEASFAAKKGAHVADEVPWRPRAAVRSVCLAWAEDRGISTGYCESKEAVNRGGLFFRVEAKVHSLMLVTVDLIPEIQVARRSGQRPYELCKVYETACDGIKLCNC